MLTAKAANHGVGQHHAQRDYHTHRVVAHTTDVDNASKGALKQFAACDQARSSVNGEENHDDDSGHRSQRQRPSGETVG